MSRKRVCEQCKRKIHPHSTRAIYLFMRPGDIEVWVCGSRCYQAYNDGDELMEVDDTLDEESIDDDQDDVESKPVTTPDPPDVEAPESASESEEIEEEVPKKKKGTFPKKGSGKGRTPYRKKGGRSAPKGNRWTQEVIKAYKADIKAKRHTYASIAKELGIRPQTVWASLNKA